MLRRPSFAAFSIVVATAAVVVAIVLATVNLDTRLTIGSGAPGTVSFRTAEQLQRQLEEQGFDVDIIPTERTLDLLDELVDPDSPIDLTFISGEVDSREYPGVDSLGTAGRQPFLFATFPMAHNVTSLAQLQGRRIDIGPQGSSRAAFAELVLAQFGVTAQNSTFLNLPALATPEEFAAADVEVITARWEDRRSFLRDKVFSDELRIISVPDAVALAGNIRSAEAVEIPIGAVSLNPPVPDKSVPTIAQLNTIVAREDLSPAAAYAVARELALLFSGGSAYSAPGEFPNFADRQLPINPYAADYYSNGSIPWQYENLPPILADSFVSLLVLGTGLLLLASIYSLFFPEVYSLWTGVIRPRRAERMIEEIELSLAQGHELTPRQRQRLSRILARHDAERVVRERADSLRPQLAGGDDSQGEATV